CGDKDEPTASSAIFAPQQSRQASIGKRAGELVISRKGQMQRAHRSGGWPRLYASVGLRELHECGNAGAYQTATKRACFLSVNRVLTTHSSGRRSIACASYRRCGAGAAK